MKNEGKEVLGCLGAIAAFIGLILWADILGLRHVQDGLFFSAVLALPIIFVVVLIVDIVQRKL